MSSIVNSFDPSSMTATTFKAPNSAANGALVFFNESNISIDLTFADGSSMYLPAWYHRHKCGYSGDVNVQWDIRQTLSSVAPPISQVIVEAFAQGEHFPADGPLVRQANVGNTINTVGGTATAVQNDGKLANTQFIESTVAAEGTSAVTLTNNGVLALGNTAHNGQLNLNGAGSLLSVVGSFNSDNLGIVSNGAGQLQVGSLVSNGAGGIVLNNGPLHLINGSLGSLSTGGVYIVGTTPTAFNHNLNVMPVQIIITILTGGNIGVVATDPATWTTTQATFVANTSNVHFGVTAFRT